MNWTTCILVAACLVLIGCDETNYYSQQNTPTPNQVTPIPVYGPKVLDYDFESVVGAEIPDRSENHMDMLVTGCTRAAGKVGMALSCGQYGSAIIKNGSPDLIRHIKNNVAVSIQFWLNYSDASGTQSTLLELGGAYVQIANGMLHFLPNYPIDLQLNTPLSAGTWYNIAITFDGSITRFYLNGVLVQTYDVISPLGYESSDSEISLFPNYYEGKLSATLDSFRVYDVILTEEQILESFVNES